VLKADEVRYHVRITERLREKFQQKQINVMEFRLHVNLNGKDKSAVIIIMIIHPLSAVQNNIISILGKNLRLIEKKIKLN